MNLSRLLAVSSLVMALLYSCQPSLPDEIQEAYEQLPENVDFNFHIRPILSDRCFACHGPDDNTREAGLRLDLETEAFAALKESKGHAIVKGNIGKSMVWQRIISNDPDIQMPPPESNLSLSTEEIALITKWIKQGAEWKNHWAFISPQKPNIPKANRENLNNPIDHFIQAKLEEQDLTSSPEANKERLIRRLSFDLTGLPPSLEDIEQFVSDASPNAYEILVDRLLETDAHAERMAMEWMDVARFADSHGLHADGLREQWPWRDWAIQAFKKNLPYNDFITWQIAGDMLPNASREQKLATGFHRNHTANSESGIISEEFRLQYVADRTNTTAKAFMGLTMECAACHDHKFDPISQKEYYQMSAFFNNVHELGMIGNDKNFGPLLPLPDTETEAKLTKISSQIESLEDSIELTAIEIASIEDYLHTIQSEKITPPKPDGIYPFNSIRNVKIKKGRTEIRLDNNKMSTASGEPEVVEGKIGNAIRLDNDYDQVFMKGLGNFNLYESFSGGGWINVEPKEGFKTIMGNIGDKNTGWRGWILFLDSLNRPGVKIVHSNSHNYIHVLAEESITEEDWNHVFLLMMVLRRLLD